ncbi:MAG: hypothetical protein ABR515_02615 [Nitrososphaeraceae archaeon]
MASKFDSNLLLDRVEFKIFAAEKHLNNLKEIELNFPNIEKIHAAIQMELEIDCFLAQLLGTLDCLLLLINTRLDLGIDSGKVDIATVQSALNARTKNISLLTDLHQASEHNSWLWILKEFRNQTMQIPSKEVQDLLIEDMTLSIKEGLNISIRTSDEYINKNTIHYFQQSVNRVRELVNSIRGKEPLLK